jgi:phosphoribosylamine--glycine ligase
MKSVLIVGSGAREHALAWKLRRSPDVGPLFVAPGNAGTRLVAENIPIPATDLEAITRLVQDQDIDFTVVGPEAPLALGLADRLRAMGRAVVGPGAAAARIESSKAFAKMLMRRAGVPTARFSVFDEPAFAFRHLMEASYPLVVKADGLAAGKGVVVCQEIHEARIALEAIMIDRVHGAAGERVVIEEALSGPEISLLALVDGQTVVPLPLAQDHKRLLDGDAGPNTGGMGAYAPVPFVDFAERTRLIELTMTPIIEVLAAMATPYRGILFAGLMLTEDGPRVLEYNCRLGDPEAQAVLPLLGDDLFPWLEAMAGGNLADLGRDAPQSTGQTAVGVVLASPGYPEKPESGGRIEGLDALPDDVLAFHAGTAVDGEGCVITAGGRVLTVVGLGASIPEAADRAYTAPVHFERMQRRGDIGRSFSYASPHPPAPSPINGRGGEKRARRIGVLASGEGSNLQAIVDACRDGAIQAEIAVVVSHNSTAGSLTRAERAGIPAVIAPLADRRDPAARRRHEERLLTILAPLDLDLLVLAGWMLIFSADFLDRCNCPVINIHPALLDPVSIPVLRGARAVRNAIGLGLPYTGVSVHVVTPEVDAGPVVISESVEIRPDDDEESLYRRIKGVEHRLLPQAIELVLRQQASNDVRASQPAQACAAVEKTFRSSQLMAQSS